MMNKKTAVIVVVAILLTGFAISSANAAGWCHAGIVTNTGVIPALANENRSQYTITVNCTAADGDWDGDLKFIMTPDLGDAGYATALTAISSGQTVEVKVAAAKSNALMSQISLNAAL